MMLPPKLWMCPGCESQFVEAWRLKRHLMLTHGLNKTQAWRLTDQSEYWLRIRQAEYVNPAEFGLDSQGRKTPAEEPNRRRQRSGN
jgi:hypothetical protein